MSVIDSDTHLYESRNLWSDYADPGDRDKCLRLDDDDLGHTWLMFGDRRISIAEVHHPGEVDKMGEYRNKVRAREKPEASYDELLPRAFWDPKARVEDLDRFGVDETVVFPNFGLLWERPISDDLDAVKINMGAWNRWTVDMAAEGKGRLHPVAHLSLRDLDWLDHQLVQLEAGGIRLAMIAPALVDGKALSDPVHDRAWDAFVRHGVTPVFHVSAFPHPFHDEWYEDEDPDDVAPVLSNVFLWTAPALALADLAIHGVFDRHPDLRLGIMELSAVWVPMYLLMLDGGYDFHARFNGEPLTQMELKPSEYVRRQVRVAAFGYERPDKLIKQAGDMFMFCSDYPHAEGLARPLDDYTRMCNLQPAQSPPLYADNLAWLLRR